MPAIATLQEHGQLSHSSSAGACDQRRRDSQAPATPPVPTLLELVSPARVTFHKQARLPQQTLPHLVRA